MSRPLRIEYPGVWFHNEMFEETRFMVVLEPYFNILFSIFKFEQDEAIFSTIEGIITMQHLSNPFTAKSFCSYEVEHKPC